MSLYLSGRHQRDEDRGDGTVASPAAVQHADNVKTLDFIKGSMFPQQGDEALPPPQFGDPITSVVTVRPTMSLNTGIQALANQRVSNQEGMVLWLPKLGYNALWHMGFMKAQTDAHPSIASAHNQPWMMSVIYNSEIAIPYAAESGKFIIRIPPNVAEQFNKIRVFNGYYSMLSNTRPIGDTALNGLFTSAVVADTIDVAQKDGSAFSQSAIVAASRQTKDSLENVSVDVGIVNVIGNDIRVDFTEPNVFAVSNQLGTWASIFSSTAPIAYTATYTVPDATTFGDTFSISNYWISPRNTSAGLWTASAMYNPISTIPWVPNRTYTGSSWPISTDTVNTNQIGEADRLDFRIRYLVTFDNNFGGPPEQPGTFAVSLHLSHCFAGITDATTGTVSYRFFTETRTHTNLNSAAPMFNFSASQSCFIIDETFISDVSSLESMSLTNPGNALDSTAASFNPLASAGKYIGTVVNVSLTYTRELAAPGGGDIIFNVLARQIYAKPHGGADIGQRGPAHITRYTNLSPEQEMTLVGTINMEAVSKSSFNQFSKSGQSAYNAPATDRCMALQQALYSDAKVESIRSVYTGEQYKAAYDELMGQSYEYFSKLLASSYSSSNRALAVVNDQGMLGNVQNAALLQPITQQEVPYNNANVTTMTGGQFGSRTDARGTYNTRAGGQFGSRAGGQFGTNTSSSGLFDDVLSGVGAASRIARHFI